jgi:hypothetical protein
VKSKQPSGRRHPAPKSSVSNASTKSAAGERKPSLMERKHDPLVEEVKQIVARQAAEDLNTALNVVVTKDLMKRVKHAAVDRDISLQQLVNEALEAHLRKEEARK